MKVIKVLRDSTLQIVGFERLDFTSPKAYSCDTFAVKKDHCISLDINTLYMLWDKAHLEAICIPISPQKGDTIGDYIFTNEPIKTPLDALHSFLKPNSDCAISGTFVGTAPFLCSKTKHIPYNENNAGLRVTGKYTAIKNDANGIVFYIVGLNTVPKKVFNEYIVFGDKDLDYYCRPKSSEITREPPVKLDRHTFIHKDMFNKLKSVDCSMVDYLNMTILEKCKPKPGYIPKPKISRLVEQTEQSVKVSRDSASSDVKEIPKICVTRCKIYGENKLCKIFIQQPTFPITKADDIIYQLPQIGGRNRDCSCIVSKLSFISP